MWDSLPFTHRSLYWQSRTHTGTSNSLSEWGNSSFGPLWPLLALGPSGRPGRLTYWERVGCLWCERYWYPSRCARWKIPPLNHLHIYFPSQTAPHALVATGDLIRPSLIGYWLTLLWQRETINYRLPDRGRWQTSWAFGGVDVIHRASNLSLHYLYISFLCM